MDIRNTPLQPDTTFHLFNRGVNGAPVFFEAKNYAYFLKQYARYVHPFITTLAYCLLGNHFHFLVRIRPEDQLQQVIRSHQDRPLYWHASNVLASLFQSYTRAMNKMYKRTGPLFESPFKRIPMQDDSHFSRLVFYIHSNPQKHRLVEDYRDYPYSSYHTYLEENKSLLINRQELFDWFGGKEGYIDFHEHQQITAPTLPEELLLE